MSLSKPDFIPLAVSWNLTKKCNLACAHCYIEASLREKGNGEFSPSESIQVLRQIAKVNPEAFLILTGGEPLLRKDIFDLIQEASSLGFFTVLGSHGGLLDEKIAERLVRCNLKGIGVSLDSLDPAKHDRFRGIPGSWEKTASAIEVMREKGISFLVETTLTKENKNELEEMASFACEKGGTALNVFFLVPTGRGANLSDLSPEEYEEAFARMAKLQKKYEGKLLINGKCAPHYRRVLWELDRSSPFVRTFNRGGCPAGTYYCRITPEGNVTPCPYMPLSAGSLREKSFEQIWNESSVLKDFRNGKLGGKCGMCEFRELCGGCRCRAYAVTGNYLAEDPSCSYQPGKYQDVSLPPEKTYGTTETAELEWTDGAKARLQNIPFFARGMAKKAIEAKAKEKGCITVTEALMAEIRSAMLDRFPLKTPSNLI